uniref:Putative cell wall surface anchor family protein n=1 Tax=Amblyomma triste TaxID=251400 RepID=A0A023G3Y8_AMBTT
MATGATTMEAAEAGAAVTETGEGVAATETEVEAEEVLGTAGATTSEVRPEATAVVVAAAATESAAMVAVAVGTIEKAIVVPAIRVGAEVVAGTAGMAGVANTMTGTATNKGAEGATEAAAAKGMVRAKAKVVAVAVAVAVATPGASSSSSRKAEPPQPQVALPGLSLKAVHRSMAQAVPTHSSSHQVNRALLQRPPTATTCRMHLASGRTRSSNSSKSLEHTRPLHSSRCSTRVLWPSRLVTRQELRPVNNSSRLPLEVQAAKHTALPIRPLHTRQRQLAQHKSKEQLGRPAAQLRTPQHKHSTTATTPSTQATLVASTTGLGTSRKEEPPPPQLS